MRSRSTRLIRLNATSGLPPAFALAPAAFIFVTVANNDAWAQIATCPSYMQRPDIIASVDASLSKLRRLPEQMSSEQVAGAIAQDLKAELRLRLPRDVMQFARPQVNALDRPIVEACYPQVTAYLRRVDVARGTTEELRAAAAEAQSLQRAKDQEDAADRERAYEERQAQLKAQLVQQKAENERQRQALAERTRAREERDAERQRIETARREEEARIEMAHREDDARIVARSEATAGAERQLLASYRSALIVQQCFDSLAGSRNVFLTRAQLVEAQSLIKSIESKLLAADASFDKNVVFASAKQEEDRLNNDPVQQSTTARGPIVRHAYDDSGKAFCEAQLNALHETASAVGATSSR